MFLLLLFFLSSLIDLSSKYNETPTIFNDFVFSLNFERQLALWYLTPELFVFSLVDSNISREEREELSRVIYRGITRMVDKAEEEVVEEQFKPMFPVVIWAPDPVAPPPPYCKNLKN